MSRPSSAHRGGPRSHPHPHPHPPPRSTAPSVRDLLSDALAPIAGKYWAAGAGAGAGMGGDEAASPAPYDPAIIEQIYTTYLHPINVKQRQRLEKEAEKAEKQETDEKDSDSKSMDESDDDGSALLKSLSAEESEQRRLDTERAQRLLLLEISAYLENYLWKNFDGESSSDAHVLSIMMLVNQKFKEDLMSIWEPFDAKPERFSAFLTRVLRLKHTRDMSVLEAREYLLFLIHAYQSFESATLRSWCMRLVTIDCWRGLRDATIIRTIQQYGEREMEKERLIRMWNKISAKPADDSAATFLPQLIVEFIHILYSIDDDSPLFHTSMSSSVSMTRRSRVILPSDVRSHLTYLERFVEFLTDLLTQRSTRRWIRQLMSEWHIIELCANSTLVKRTKQREEEIQKLQADMAARRGAASSAAEVQRLAAETAVSGGAILSNNNYANTNQSISPSALPGRLFCQLLDMLDYYQHFELDDVTGQPLTRQHVTQRHYLDVQLLQKVCFKFFNDVPQLRNIALAHVSQIGQRQSLADMLSGVDEQQLKQLTIKLQLLPKESEVELYKKQQEDSKQKGKHVPRFIIPLLPYMSSHSFLLSLLLSRFTPRPDPSAEVAAMPLYPSDTLLFDENAVPSLNYTGETALALPKLNMQFLSLHDYLRRNFHLYKCESTYEIREDIAMTVKRLRPRLAGDGSTVFTGWARMACPILAFTITAALKPLIGHTKSSVVRGEITVDLSVFSGIVREEWDNIRQHDVLFLLSVHALVPMQQGAANPAMVQRQSDHKRHKVDVDAGDLDSGAMADEEYRTLVNEPLLIRFVRGACVTGVLDMHKRLIGERDDKGNVYQGKGSVRTFRVELDAAQYQMDQARRVEQMAAAGPNPLQPDVYTTFNLLLRRKPKENNFKPVLESVRDTMDDSMSGAVSLPSWLHHVFLGYGDPKQAQYYSVALKDRQHVTIEFVDTFLDLQHLQDSFIESVEVEEKSREEREAEEKGEKELTLVAMGDMANNRQTAAATAMQLARQVIRLMAAAKKEKQPSADTNMADGESSASASASSSSSTTPADPSRTTFRVTFPAGVEPNYRALQQLLYINEPNTATTQSTQQGRFMMDEAQQAVNASDTIKEEKKQAEAATDDESKTADTMEVDTSSSVDVTGTSDQPPSPPQLEDLQSPPPFTLQPPTFTLQQPVKPDSSNTSVSHASLPSADSSTPSSSSASSSSLDADIASLPKLTVVQLKDRLKGMGLPITGLKAALVERLSEAMREQHDKETEGGGSTPEEGQANADAMAKYEQELAAYNSAKSAHDESMRQYEAARQSHANAVAEYEKRVAEQNRAKEEYAKQLKEYEQKKQAQAQPKRQPAQDGDPSHKLDADGDATMDSTNTTTADKDNANATMTAAAAAAAPAQSVTSVPAVPSVPPSFTRSSLPSSPHTLHVELLPRVHARHGYMKRNLVRFTPIQVEAIKSGLNPGLTMIVGPPGTGKTDTAVQIMSELYHNFPEQRTLVITHSNMALNDLFEKIMERDIDERYLLRLGRGSEELASVSDMGKFGRVNYMLQRRLTLLEEVAALARAIGVDEGVAATCETSGHFFLQQVLARWEKFTTVVQQAQTKGEADSQLIAQHFPFTHYFTKREEKQAKIWQQYWATQSPADGSNDEAAQPSSSSNGSVGPTPITLFRGVNFGEDMSIALSCWADVQQTFVELEETRPFELLRSYKDRSNYLLTKHAKIIAMTCTHAAIKRRDLIDLNFNYDNVIMEESGQILDIETLLPLLLQRNDSSSSSRLQRVILLGDHRQLPPVVQNRSLQKYSHLDQSLFTRFIRLGMPYIQLNAQGRMRGTIANLWNWNYENLGNLPTIAQNPAYKFGNVGFAHEYQVINVDDLNGVGESSPVPFFYQNLAEAEYVVQTYMYMRLLGYPAHRISILTTYNGQKHLIRDILQQRCANNLLFGLPAKVSTVDKYQGQQNDFILLSLVRTRTAGHLRDVRRLVVAMSRARLGLYVFARVSLFVNCFELTRTFNQLLRKPVRLHLLPHEKRPMDAPFGTDRPVDAVIPPQHVLEVRDVMHMGELVASMTLSVQSEYGEYQRRIAAAAEEERQKRVERERVAREYEQAREATRREDARFAAMAAREREHARETVRLDRELAEERREEEETTAARALPAESESDVSEDED